MGRGLIALTAMQDGLQRRALSLVGAFIDDRLKLTFALEDRARPSIEHRTAQTGQIGIAVMALFDLERFESLTTAVRR